MSGGEQPTDRPAEAPALRASDAERERTAVILRDHAAAGRLTPEELDERLDAAYAARTVGELDALVHDLPADAAAPVARTPPRSAAREAARRRLLHAIGQAVLVSAAAIAIWLATGADGSFWPKWVVLVSAIRIAFAAWGELGPAGAAGSGSESRLGRGGVRPRDPLPPPPPRPDPPGR
ncbi:MAG TPA: DUF1707 domain-containing protein [Conexibacter sp.]|jgi:hypothetical protein|nr:DUF1707 domain-containing protein [Conexibacter sp.]